MNEKCIFETGGKYFFENIGIRIDIARIFENIVS